MDTSAPLAPRWYASFLGSVQKYEAANSLRDAANSGKLKKWTTEITGVVAHSLGPMGWEGAARGHRCTTLPVQREEYLSLDVVAFEKTGDHRWRFPAAVFELENGQADDTVAYSLWKVLNVRANLRVVFCYRRDATRGVEIAKHLSEHVVKEMGISGRAAVGGETLLVVGSRAETSTFPFGFFKSWSLDLNLGRFTRF